MRPTITEVKPLEKYKLLVRFDDATEGELDLQHLAGQGVFKIWDEGDVFFRVFVSPETNALTWPGEIDIDTYNAYCTIKGISPEQFFQSQNVHATR